jgi:hypothetical protein
MQRNPVQRLLQPLCRGLAALEEVAPACAPSCSYSTEAAAPAAQQQVYRPIATTDIQQYRAALVLYNREKAKWKREVSALRRCGGRARARPFLRSRARAARGRSTLPRSCGRRRRRQWYEEYQEERRRQHEVKAAQRAQRAQAMERRAEEHRSEAAAAKLLHEIRQAELELQIVGGRARPPAAARLPLLLPRPCGRCSAPEQPAARAAPRALVPLPRAAG